MEAGRRKQQKKGKKSGRKNEDQFFLGLFIVLVVYPFTISDDNFLFICTL